MGMKKWLKIQKEMPSFFVRLPIHELNVLKKCIAALENAGHNIAISVLCLVFNVITSKINFLKQDLI